MLGSQDHHNGWQFPWESQTPQCRNLLACGPKCNFLLFLLWHSSPHFPGFEDAKNLARKDGLEFLKSFPFFVDFESDSRQLEAFGSARSSYPHRSISTSCINWFAGSFGIWQGAAQKRTKTEPTFWEFGDIWWPLLFIFDSGALWLWHASFEVNSGAGAVLRLLRALQYTYHRALHQDSFAILWAKAGALRRIYGATREEQILALSALNDVAWQSNSEHVDPVWSIHYKIAKHTFLCSNVWFRNATWFLQSCELSSFRSICQSSHGMTSPCSWVSPGISSQRWA